jgi:hypothetical protein
MNATETAAKGAADTSDELQFDDQSKKGAGIC